MVLRKSKVNDETDEAAQRGTASFKTTFVDPLLYETEKVNYQTPSTVLAEIDMDTRNCMSYVFYNGIFAFDS